MEVIFTGADKGVEGGKVLDEMALDVRVCRIS